MTWMQIREKVLREIKPSSEREHEVRRFAEKTMERINQVLSEKNINAVAELHGSVAHGTWLKDQLDLDVFIVIQEYEGREQLMEVLDAIQEGTDWSFTKAYAEHPYLKTNINGYTLEIVPCYKAEPGETLHSSTDRTPLHTRWLADHLDGLRDDVRLLKLFLDVQGIYGAEIKIGGFSGYLCELLVVYYGGFQQTLEGASQWGKKTTLSFTPNPEEFDTPLTFIDPVDAKRNVASALREKPYNLFRAAARWFLKNPSASFFTKKEGVKNPEVALKMLSERPTDILFMVIEESNSEVADVLWGQIRKSVKAIGYQLEKKGYKVLRNTAWSNEQTRHIFIYELESASIPDAVVHVGPPLHFEANVQRFIKTYKDNPKTIAGPDLKGDRWYVIVKRGQTHVKEVLESLLSDGGRGIGVSRKLSIRILQHHRVLLNNEIKDYLSEDFTGFLIKWLKGRPKWIE